MATFFLRIRSHFVNIFNKISWESPKITSPKSPKTSDSWNTEILPIPTAISTKSCPFELKYKGRRTRNTQVRRHKITAYVSARPMSRVKTLWKIWLIMILFYFCWPHFITTEGGVGEHEVMITTLPSYRGTIRHSCGICCFGALLQRGFSNIFIAQPRRKQTTTGIYMRGLRNHRQFFWRGWWGHYV